RRGRSGKELLDRLPFGQPIRPPGQIMNLGHGVQSKSPEERCGQVSRGDRVRCRISAYLVAGPVRRTTVYTASRQHDAVAVRPMVPAAGFIEARRSAEFRQREYQG